MPEDSATPTIIVPYKGKIAIYSAMLKKAYRVFWNPAAKKLTLDKSWEPSYLAERPDRRRRARPTWATGS